MTRVERQLSADQPNRPAKMVGTPTSRGSSLSPPAGRQCFLPSQLLASAAFTHAATSARARPGAWAGMGGAAVWTGRNLGSIRTGISPTHRIDPPARGHLDHVREPAGPRRSGAKMCLAIDNRCHAGCLKVHRVKGGQACLGGRPDRPRTPTGAFGKTREPTSIGSAAGSHSRDLAATHRAHPGSGGHLLPTDRSGVQMWKKFLCGLCNAPDLYRTEREHSYGGRFPCPGCYPE